MGLKWDQSQEIAEVLSIPMGTVKSRIARGIAQLHKALADTSRPVRKDSP